MMNMYMTIKLFSCIAAVLLISGCVSGRLSDNKGQVQSYPAPTIEAAWIRDGQPLEFAGETWYAVKDIEVLLDAEVYQVGEYKGVQLFIDKLDTKPYQRIYTKFAKNKFRYFERKNK